MMNKEQLNDILENHKKWLDDEEDGERANLSYADLSGACEQVAGVERKVAYETREEQ